MRPAYLLNLWEGWLKVIFFDPFHLFDFFSMYRIYLDGLSLYF